MTVATVMEHTVERVPSAFVADLWPGIEHLVAAAADHWPRDRSADDYLEACKHADAQLWLIHQDRKLRAVFITEIVLWPRQRVAILELMGGEGYDDWHTELDAAVTAWAREFDCDVIRSGGRLGLKKNAMKHGYKVCAILMEKDLRDG